MTTKLFVVFSFFFFPIGAGLAPISTKKVEHQRNFSNVRGRNRFALLQTVLETDPIFREEMALAQKLKGLQASKAVLVKPPPSKTTIRRPFLPTDFLPERIVRRLRCGQSR